MNLIWISPECPFPANTGGRIGIWKRVVNLAEDNDIYFFCVVDKEEQKYKDEIGKYCKKVFLYNRKKNIQTVLKSFKIPYPVVSRWNKYMVKEIEKLSYEIEIDFIIVDTPQMMMNLSKNVIKNNKVILNQHNIEFLAFASLASAMSNTVKRYIYKMVAKQLEFYETKIYKKNAISIYTFVSSKDKVFFEKKFNIQNTILVPVGADLDYQSEIPKSHEIVFISKLSYPANFDGAMWFLKEVWDKIVCEVLDAKFFLVGKDPCDALIEEAEKHKNVIVTGLVDSVNPFYKRSQLVIVPLLSGGGVKVKLMEALGHGKIVITTKKGIEGTDFENNVEVIEKNNAEEFALACIDVLNNPTKFESIRKRSFEKMKDNYSWHSIISGFESQLRDMKNEKK